MCDIMYIAYEKKVTMIQCFILRFKYSTVGPFRLLAVLEKE